MKNLIFVLLISLLLNGCIHYSDGYRTGKIIKFSNKGIICKTWEGEMLLGGFRKDSEGNVEANNFTFSIDSENQEDQKIVDEILSAMDSGKRVKLHYSQEIFTSPCRSSTDYFIKKVELLD